MRSEKMGFIYGLAVLLVIFEGIIIECEGGRAFPSNQAKEDERYWPDDIINLILNELDFEKIREIARANKIRTTEIVLSKILPDHKIYIRPERKQKINRNSLGDFEIGSYEGLEIFFKKFGGRIKKIEIDLSECSGPRRNISQNIIRRYANNFEELRILGSPSQHDQFWNEILNGENGINFPAVKKLQIQGDICRNEFKLNSIFPKLEIFELDGCIADVNCFENVKELKEFILETEPIEEDRLYDIFANNKIMTRIRVMEPNRTEAMDSIAKHLTKLKTLEVVWPGDKFLFRANNGTACKLPSVTHLSIVFNTIGETFGSGNLSFYMPHLEKLKLRGQADDRIIDFIQHFKELEKLEFNIFNYCPLECIKKLKHIKEFTTDCYESSFVPLIRMFKDFDNESKLQTVKLLNAPHYLYVKYENEMKGINADLKIKKKPMWTISLEENIETRRNDMVFRQE